MGPSARAAVPVLAGLLADRDEDVRIAAAAALERISPEFTGGDRRGIVAVIDSLVPRLMEELHVPGVSIALILDREIAWSRSFGYADAARKLPVRGNTLFEACSMSKPVFAYIVLKLAEEGAIGLDVPLSDYVQSVPEDLRPITARMALSHTSGLPNWRKGDEEREGPLTVAFTPGARFSYSGEGIFYLQRAVEGITGEPLDVLASRRLFRPMGLGSCSYVWTDSLDSRIAAGHDDRGQLLQKTAYVHPNAAYSLYVSAEDYAHLLLEVMKIDRSAPYSLSRRSVDTMLSRQVRLDSRDPIVRPGKARGSGVYWGLGWSINSTPAGDIAHHGGANRSGFRCFSQFSRERGTGIVIFTNSTGGGELWARVISRVGDL
jgi:CubicO group peptidase (beta-lactamase class C family)